MPLPNNSILWIFLFGCLSFLMIGQSNNNIFNGGTQDGYHENGMIQSSNNSVFIGSQGDGHDLSSFIPSVSNNLFIGGSGDGFDQSNYIPILNNLVFSGGDADGHDLAYYILAANNGIYVGATADGFDASYYILPSGNGIFAGGTSDGFDHIHYLQTSSNSIFAGGIGDGFDLSCGFASLCSNDSVTILAQSCTPGDTGISIQNLTNTAGCDSMVVTITSLLPSYDTLINIQTCNIGDTGTFVQAFITIGGCDSTVTTIITFDQGSQMVLPQAAICKGDSVMIFGLYQTMAGTYFDTLANQNGCDSILAQSLIVNSIDTTLLTANTNDSTMAGVFVDTLTNNAGCDSIVITTFIYQPGPCSIDSVTVHEISCDSSMAGVSVTNYLGNDGCDSVVTTITVFDPGSTTALPDVQICDGDSIQIFGVFRKIAGNYVDSLVNRNGCDSILTTTLVVKPTANNLVLDSICPGDSLYLGGAWQTVSGNYVDVFTASYGCDSVLTTLLIIRSDSGCIVDTTTQNCVTVVSDNTWMKSTVVSSSNLFGLWNGVSSLPASATFTDAVVIGQPYGYPSINDIDGSDVISTGNSITYFRKEFLLNQINDLDVRLLITVDDQADIYLNGQRVALITNFGRSNYKFPAHDLKFYSNGTVSNGFMGGDAFNVVPPSIHGTLVTGTNEVIVAVRNLGKVNDKGGFSFRMDINCQDSSIIRKASEFAGTDLGLLVYPNPATEVVNIDTELAINGIRLFDFAGKLIIAETYNSEKTVKVDLKGLPKGVYIFEIEEVGHQISTVKIVKQ